jgi:hypothetical protein
MDLNQIDNFISSNKRTLGRIDVEFDDEVVINMKKRRATFHMFFWRILKKWNLPITSVYFHEEEHVDMDVVNELNSKILQEILNQPRPSIQKFKEDVWYLLNELMNFIMENCQTNHSGIDIVSICELANTPEVKQITTDKVLGKRNSVKEAEIALKTNFEKLGEVIATLDVPCNTLKSLLNLRLINRVQIAHIFYQIGFRTDITDRIIPYSISTGYLDGLESLEDMVFESLSAKKSIFYNKMSIPESQYNNRTQHLLSAALPKLYAGDCGSTLTIPITITPENKMDFVFNNIVVNGRLMLLTKDNIDNYIGKVVNKRSPMLCRHTDGVCETCGGRLISTINPSKHIGIIAAIKVTNKVVQKILSSKHFQTTNIMEYSIPKDLKKVLLLKQQHIFFRHMVHNKLKKAVLGIPTNNTLNVINMDTVNEKVLSKLTEAQFGRITQLIIRGKTQPLTDLIDLEVDGKCPLFCKEFISYIRSKASEIETKDEFMWIPLNDFDFKKPVFKVLIENDSMIRFVHNYSAFLNNSIAKYTNIKDVFDDFYDIVTKQVNINTAYLEMILRGYMITDEFDTRIPIVTDIDDVRFAKMADLVTVRSIGATLAYEKLHLTLIDPTTYLRPRPESMFDKFMNTSRIVDPPKLLC